MRTPQELSIGMIITEEDLKTLELMPDEAPDFRKQYPNGFVVTEGNLLKAARLGFESIPWEIINRLEAYYPEKLARFLEMRHPDWKTYFKAVRTYWSTFEKAKASASNEKENEAAIEVLLKAKASASDALDEAQAAAIIAVLSDETPTSA